MERAFDRRWLGSLTGWALIVANVVSAATITVGFVAYLSIFVDINHWVATTLVVVAVAGVAAAGMKESVWLMMATTLIGIGTLDVADLVGTYLDYIFRHVAQQGVSAEAGRACAHLERLRCGLFHSIQRIAHAAEAHEMIDPAQ